MIQDVTLNQTKYGLPANTQWIGASYSGSANGCDVYANPEHGRMHVGVRYPQFIGSKYVATCRNDRSTRGLAVLPSNWIRAAYGSPTKGSVYIFFGGLYRGASTTASGVFAQTQAYWKGTP